MVFEIDIIPYYRDLLIKAIPTNASSIQQCVLKKWLLDLAHTLEIDSMRLYLYDDKNNKNYVQQIYGDKEIWKDVDITRFKKERTKFKKLFFVKIRHVRENGQFLTLGYLAFCTERYVSDDLLSALDVLCMLYGNYIVKRLVAGQYERMTSILPNAYLTASSNQLPGTKVLKLLEIFRKLSSFNQGLYCTVCNNTLAPEYFVRERFNYFPKKIRLWYVDPSFIRELKDKHMGFKCSLASVPQQVSKFMTRGDNRHIDSFNVSIVPVFVDTELIGIWFFSYSENNPFADFDVNRVLVSLEDILKDTYSFLFQRRYNSMIVNPIFQNRDTRVNHDSVFVIMPFTESWSNDIWEQVIRPAVKEIGMSPLRADDLYGQNIMEDVWQSILKSAIIICDTTGRNPNVFYELGIAHTLGKKVLLLTQCIDDIPFDLQAYRHIQYDVSISGAAHLKDTIKKYIQETLNSD